MSGEVVLMTLHGGMGTLLAPVVSGAIFVVRVLLFRRGTCWSNRRC